MKSYDKCKVAERKRKRKEPRRIIRGSAVVKDLRAFVRKHKTGNVQKTRKLPMPLSKPL